MAVKLVIFCHFVQVCWVHLEDCPWHKSLLQVELLWYIKHCYQLSHGWDVGFLSFWFQCKSCCLRSTFQVVPTCGNLSWRKKVGDGVMKFDGRKKWTCTSSFWGQISNIPLFARVEKHPKLVSRISEPSVQL